MTRVDRVVFRAALVLGVFVLFVGALALITGCPNAAEITVDQANVVAYGAAQQKCVDQADARAQADLCIMQVKSQYCGAGGLLYEAGACTYPTLSPLDGGTQ